VSNYTQTTPSPLDDVENILVYQNSWQQLSFGVANSSEGEQRFFAASWNQTHSCAAHGVPDSLSLW